jgi:surface antigen
MSILRVSTVLVVAIALAGCAGDGRGQKETFGGLIGAGLGTLVGSQLGSGIGKFTAIGVGTLAGAYIGSEVGKSLDRADRLAMRRSTQSALENNRIGQHASWRNPDSGHAGTTTPTKTYELALGEFCREYQQTVTIDGKVQNAFGKACRQPDGSWKIVN